MTGRRIQSSDNGMKAAPDLSAMAVRATFGNDHAEAPASEVYRIKTKGEEQPFRCRSNGTAGVLFRQQAPLDPMRPMLAPALRSGWGQARTTACHGL